MPQTYDIGLEIAYRYERPASMGRHLLRLLPLSIEGEQQLISGRLILDPLPDDRRDSRDFFGNAMSEIAYDRPVAEVTFRIEARVRRAAEPPQADLAPPLARLAADLARVRSLGPASPHHFTGASERISPSPPLTGYAWDAIGPGAGSVSAFHAVRQVCSALHRDMAYDPDATEVDTDPLESFGLRRGVCQDFSHIMIACLRGIGVPAGYVSGFLRTIPPPGGARLDGADAMHAWVRAWCGADLGWIGFDPTNDLIAADDHVSVAIGRDYADVAPVHGQLRASGMQGSSQKVDVVPL